MAEASQERRLTASRSRSGSGGFAARGLLDDEAVRRGSYVSFDLEETAAALEEDTEKGRSYRTFFALGFAVVPAPLAAP